MSYHLLMVMGYLMHVIVKVILNVMEIVTEQMLQNLSKILVGTLLKILVKLAIRVMEILIVTRTVMGQMQLYSNKTSAGASSTTPVLYVKRA